MEGVDFTRADLAGVQHWKMHRLNKAYTPCLGPGFYTKILDPNKNFEHKTIPGLYPFYTISRVNAGLTVSINGYHKNNPGHVHFNCRMTRD